jgi:hypothetical protein
MSRGLGKMQRDILNALEPAKQAHASGGLDYRGGASWANYHSEQGEKYSGKPREQMVRSNGQDRALPADAYDLRATLAYLSRTTKAGRHIENPILQSWDVDRRFAVSFSRAVRTLIERGELVQLLPDGARDVREIRFVARP